MLVIRRLVDRRRAYTALLLKGEPPRIFPTTDQEHGRILQIYKQDRRHEGIVNDFTDFDLGTAQPLHEPGDHPGTQPGRPVKSISCPSGP